MKLRYMWLVGMLLTGIPNLYSQIKIVVRKDKAPPTLQYHQKDSAGLDYDSDSVIAKGKDGQWLYLIAAKKPIFFAPSEISGYKAWNFYMTLHPGDSIHVDLSSGKNHWSGRGIENFSIRHDLWKLQQEYKKLSNPTYHITRSLADFLEWNSYFNDFTKQLSVVVDSYKGKIKNEELDEIRAGMITDAETHRLDKFGGVWSKAKDFNLTKADLVRIWDSCFYSASAVWARSRTDQEPTIAFVSFEVMRQFLFDRDSLKKEKRKLLYFEHAANVYKGLTLQRFYRRFIPRDVIKDLGFIPETEEILSKYYSLDAPAPFRQEVKDYEQKARRLVKNEHAPDFTLYDTRDQVVTKKQFERKLLLLDFWFTGCKGCIQMAPQMRELEERYKADSNLVFASVSVDSKKEVWLKSIREGKYVSGTSLNLYTGGVADEHPMIKAYQITGYPTLYLLDGEGKIAASPLPDPNDENGKALPRLLDQKLMELKDGPYVTIEKDKKIASYINGNSIIRKVSSSTEKLNISIPGSDRKKEIHFPLKQSLKNEPVSFDKPVKLLALSDIEGNFNEFRKLLQANGVIDANYSWTFGKGHLVINGDVFDRGRQVTECLWLIYMLEDKAKAAGGYVHFILGNHELMNMQGNDRYIQQKYKDNAKMLGQSIPELYGQHTELGRWLRTKNIVEKIGDLLFMHAGASDEFNQLSLSLPEINTIARLHYDDTAKSYSDPALKIIMNTKVGPFWYRNYYLDNPIEISYPSGDTAFKATYQQVDVTLKKFGVSRIITGHTIVDPGDTINVHYNGKVINTDTRHAKGKSEALLIEGDRFYRVNQEGKKVLLFTDNRKLK